MRLKRLKNGADGWKDIRLWAMSGNRKGYIWMIILAAVSVWLAATAIHNLTYEPEYTASSTLVVSVKGQTDAYASLSLTSQMADVFGQVFQSDALREKIIEDVGENIEGTISCVPVAETNLLVHVKERHHPPKIGKPV